MTDLHKNQDNNEIKAWVFLSHSNKDYEKVTVVRNLLEQCNKRPIMFFLKCAEEKKELDSLIKREIDARDQFILCDSENARESEWVKEEVRYIKSKGRVYQTVNLNDSYDAIKETVLHFVNRSNVFITCSRRDSALAKDVIKLLEQRGFSVWWDMRSIRPGDIIVSAIADALDSTVKHGYQLLLVSKSFMESSYCRKEVLYFDARGGSKWIVPVKIDKTPLSPELQFILANRIIGDVSKYDAQEVKARKIVEALVQRDIELSR